MLAHPWMKLDLSNEQKPAEANADKK